MLPLNQSSAASGVRVGILHSQTGTMALSERPLIDAALMAIAQINQAGGVLGQTIEPLVVDGASDPAEFKRQAQQLIQFEGVTTVFGCWTSATRKAVKPTFETLNALLWYPLQYEGLESSPNIFYTGACPNQQVEPAVTWLLSHKGKRFYLLGSDYVFPRTLNKIIASQLKQQGGEVVGEEYVDLGETDFSGAIARIQQTQPDVVFNTLNGQGNQFFYRQYRDAGITADDIPILAVSVAEVELQTLDDVAVGHYASWSYFQSLDTPENNRFVQQFQARYGANRVTSDPIEAAYSQVYLWKLAVESAQSFAVDQVRLAAYNQSFAAPGGLIQIQPNHHVGKYSYIGQILPGGQFQVIHRSEKLIKPLPWLGVEKLDFNKSDLVIEMLSQVSQGIQETWLSEQKSRQLEALTHKLKQAEQALQESAIALRNHNLVLTQLAKSPAIHQGDLSAAFAEINQAGVQSLGVERTGIWLFDKTRTKLHCFDLFDKHQNHHSQGIELAVANYPIYFQALQHDQLIAADYAQTDPRTQELSASYLIPWGITSVLDVPIQIRGEIAGIICLGQVGRIRHWTPEDQNFARSLADLVSLAIEARERNQTEFDLAESQRSLATLMSNIPGIAYRCLNDSDWTMLFISEGCYELTGYPVEAFTKQKILTYNQLIHPDDQNSVFDQVQAAIDNHHSYQLTYRIITATGELKWVWEQGQGIFYPDGRVFYLEGLITDITAQQQTEAALRKSEDRWQLVLNSTQDGIFEWNIATGKVFASPHLGGMLGYTDPTVLESFDRWRNLVHPEDIDQVLATLQNHLTQKTPPYKFEYRMRCQDGSYKWILARGQVQWNENGQPVRVVGSQQDISDRKQAEEEVKLLLNLSQAINAASDFDTALEVALQQLCEITGWIYGEAWIPSTDESILVSSRSWHCQRQRLDPSLQVAIEGFREYSKLLTFYPGEEIPGKVWLTQHSQWIRDFSQIDDVLLRLESATACGLKAGFGVPIIANVNPDQPTTQPNSCLLSSPSSVLAILVFFIHANGSEDKRLTKLVNGMAAQLGTVLQQKKVQAEMKALFAAMTDRVTVRDVSGRCLNMIPTKVANVYKLPEAMMGRKLHEDLPRPQADRILQAILQAISTQETVSIEYSLRIDGKEIWLAETISPLSTETAILVARDISDRKQAEAALYVEKQKSEQLLLNILPQPIVEQLRNNPDVIAEQFNDVTILFADLVGFTPLGARLKPIELVKLLNHIFSRFDELVDQLGLEKIKTIGDAYMVAAGLPIPRSDHAEAIAQMALAMQGAMKRFQVELGEDIKIRIGINTGVVVAGVIGTKKFIYDLWGDAVNIASRMESSGEAGRIQVTEATYERLKYNYQLEKRGAINVRGRGEMVTYWLIGDQA
ncbi:transporter substrate-binding protein [Coleofasciculus sp. G2-EDA-02]|uniref:transporter substrate-binding protein n=1 Tax=Coleofasciculus sp. G2-EDA-02 TaxID=3069529 RepID=UPI0032F67149